jgi:ribosomal protein S18 acetylase RimI-like enzyme
MVDGDEPDLILEEARDRDIDACERILRSLPDWFGIEESIVEYVAEMREMRTFVVRIDRRVIGFLALNHHNDTTSDIHVIAVDRRHHRRGIGRMLVEEAVRVARVEGRLLLEVKTLGPSHPDLNYAGTRRFYEAMGFLPLEEIHDLWPGNPCLIMVKVLDERAVR